jgi:hypothetical protein
MFVKILILRFQISEYEFFKRDQAETDICDY